MTRVIACEVMREELLAVKASHPVTFEFVSMGLHLWPERLREELRGILERAGGPERIVLAFGLCGGAVAGLRSPGVPLFVPRAHDCIPLFFGSREAYEAARAEETGTFYVTGGWMEGERTLLSEYRRAREAYGERKARRVMATLFESYRRLVFVRTGHPREGAHLALAMETANLLKLELKERTGKSSWLERLVNGPWTEDLFLEVEADGEIRQEDFLTRADAHAKHHA